MHAAIKQNIFTTFQAAKACGVYHTTVINWVNTGRLKAHSTPGGHRRIRHEDLIDFMNRFSMPLPPDLLLCAKRILIVEDDPSVQRMLQRTLGSIDEVAVDSCCGGIEALIAIGRQMPDILVLDIRIPQVNGLEVCRILKSNPQTNPIKIIAVTGEALTEAEEGFLIDNTEAFFHKPLSTDSLRKTVAELLEQPAQQS